MTIIKHGKISPYIKRLTCSKCKTIFEVDDNEAKYTEQLGQIHDGLKERNVKCPVCGLIIYFNFME